MRDDRQATVRRLAAATFARLVATARAAGAGPDAEDAVQDVLARLVAGAGDLPAEPERLEAYAAAAVRRRALDLRERRRLDAEPADAATPQTGPAEAYERRRALRAYVQAVGDLPERTRAALVLDAAGWDRAAVAARLRVSERAVKRELDEHRLAVLARVAADLDGSECDRLAATLAAYATTGRAPRPGGPVARHLDLCDACRAARLAALRTRTALRSIFGVPTAVGIGAGPAPAPLTALLSKGWLAALIAAALLTGGSTYGALHDSHVARPAPLRAVAAHVVLQIATPPFASPARAARVAASLRRAAVRAERRVAVDPYAARVPPGGCDLGTLGICGVGGGG
jgi:RNA polymerase sigma factor (sigma-70 family)